MADGKVVIETDLDSSGIEKGLSKMAGLTKTGLKAATAAVGAATTVIAGAGVAAIKVGSDFESGMSKVAAISGATGRELDALTEKAKEMGAKTKFSATESAAAFEYMAMAGWKTEDMLGGIEGIMNLAAASGEDLATTSDIVTDALTAFGLQASDSAHFADVLAKASSSSNTNVGMMGDTFKYVAPLAGAMGYTIEDTAVAIGVMANSGIKASEAGTSLRAMFTRLAKPPKDAAAAMDALCISITNTDGSMKPLSDVIGILREKFAGLSEEQKIQYASSLAGQEAMSGLLAIVNASETDFQALTDSINNADGAAQEMAETMQNNLKGDLEELSGGLETLGLSIYENMVDTLRDAAKEGINYVEQLTEAFNNGGLQGVVSQAGDIFADIVTKAAEQAPKAVNAGVKMVQSFVDGIIDNRGRLATAALDIAKTLAGGLSKLLPAEMQKPVQDAINAITRSFQSGGLKKAIDSAITLFKNLSKIVGKIAKVVLPILTKAVDILAGNLDILVPAITAVTVALKAWKTAEKVSKLLDSINSTAKAGQLALAKYASANGVAAMSMATANGAMTVQQTVLAGVTGKIGLATAAQNLFNAALSAAGGPIGLAVGALAALVAGIGAYKLLTDEGISSEKQLQKANEDLGNSWGVAGQAASDFLSGISSAGSIFDNFNDSIIVSNERQQELSSKMDSVQGEITEIARTATEERRQLTQTEIDRLDELFQQLEELTAQELAYQQAYQDAVKNSAEALATTHEGSAEEYASSSQKIINSAHETAQAVIDKAYEQMMETNALNKQRLDTDASYTQQDFDNACAMAQQKYNEVVATANAECVETVRIARNGFEERASGYNEFLQKITELNGQSESETTRHEEALAAEQKRYEEERSSSMFNLADAEARHAKEVEEINSSHEQNMSSIYSNLTSSMTTEQAKLTGVWLGYVADAALHGEEMDAETKNAVDAIIQNWDSLPDGCKDSLKYALQGAVDGFRDNEPELLSQAQSTSDNFLNTLNTALGVNSPSWKTQEMMGYVVEGAVNGLTTGTPTLITAGQTLMTSFMQALTGGATQESASQMGMSVVNSIVTALSSGTVLVSGAATKLGNSVVLGFKGASASTGAAAAGQVVSSMVGAINGRVGSARVSGVNLGNAVGTGIRSSAMIAVATSQASQVVQTFTRAIQAGVSAALTAGRNLATAVANGMRAANVSSTAQTEGKKIADGFCKGINNGKSAANTAGNGLAKSAASALANYGLYGSGHDTGENFASGFANGISANAYRAVAQASAMARAAANAANAALGIHSPSRVGHWIGRMFDEGTAGGILDNTDLVEDAGTKVANALIEKMDVQAAYEKMRAAIQVESQKLGVMLTSKVQYVNSAEPETGKVVNQTININQPVSSPVETARAIRQQEIYGLAGA